MSEEGAVNMGLFYRRLLLLCDYGPGLLDGLFRTLDFLGLSSLTLIRKRNNTTWRDSRTHVVNLPLRVYGEEDPLSIASIASLVTYLVMATLFGIIAVVKYRIEAILGVYGFPQGVVAVLIGRLTGRKTAILTNGGDIDVFLRSPLLRPVMVAFMRQANAVTALNRTKAARLRSLGIDVMINPTIGVDTYQFGYVSFEKKQKRQALYAGRLAREKCPQILVGASQQLARCGVGLKILIVGDGPLRREIENMIRFNSAISVRGYVRHSTIHELFQKSNIFILPSLREGVSVSLLEAMSSGCICIVSDVIDNRELIQDRRSGLLFRSDDVEDLASKIKWVFAQNPTVLRSIASNARRVVEEGYSLQKVADAYSSLLSRIAK